MKERWQLNKFRLRVHPTRILLHQLVKFQSGKFAINIDDRPNTDQLRFWVVFEDCSIDIGDQIDTLYNQPSVLLWTTNTEYCADADSGHL